MQEWFSHFFTDVSADVYDAIQLLRPDYKAAMRVLRGKAGHVVRKKPGHISVLDVACGDAIATRQVFAKFDRPALQKIRFVGVDHDKNLLHEAKQRWPQLHIYHSDMVRASIKEQFDLILCSFAYHHAADSEKTVLCEKLATWCKPDGDLLVLEICLNEKQVRQYYSNVKAALGTSPMRDLCGRFLDWTMSNDCLSNGEWKVPMSRVEQDFKAAGWKLHEKKPVWTTPTLPPGAGCYYLHYRHTS